ncbi:MAG TPA: SprT family zinc-dependent metalloprotease [Alphaproteobacteria bacterium]|nr:SprT family zinc-dependent metalloprotease [Alphaproteobacteria bacterium]
MVDFSTISPHLNVRISPKAKRLALRLDAHAGRIDLVIPERASLKKAYKFAESNQHWIETKINALPQPIPFTDGQSVPLLGKLHTIRIIKTGKKYTSINMIGDEIQVETQLDDPSQRITRFLRSYAEKELRKLADIKAATLNRTLSSFCVRDMKSRWGSCSTDGRMTLSWRLLFAPLEAIDYVVAHESAHLTHADHSKKFWALCEGLSADYSTGKEWMRLNGIHLGRYGKSLAPSQESPAE